MQIRVPAILVVETTSFGLEERENTSRYKFNLKPNYKTRIQVYADTDPKLERV
jgi:hypothetical protein